MNGNAHNFMLIALVRKTSINFLAVPKSDRLSPLFIPIILLPFATAIHFLKEDFHKIIS